MSIVLDGCVQCTSQSLGLLSIHCPRLSAISVAKCFRMGNQSVAALLSPELCPVSESFNQNGHCYAGRGKHMQLRFLNLTMCHKISVLEPLASIDTLVKLDITGCGLVTDMQLANAVSRSGKSIQHLYINNCTNITGQGVIAVAQTCPHLETLCMRALAVSDTDLQQLSRYLLQLKNLDLSMVGST